MQEEIKKEMFYQGYCTEFAIELRKFLKNKNLRYARIEGLIENFDYDEYFDEIEDKYIWEPCHAIIIEKGNKDKYFDVDGLVFFDINKIDEYGFSGKPKEIRIVEYEKKYEEEFQYLFGEINEEALRLAKEYINKNKNLYKKLLERKGKKNIKKMI